MALPNLRIYYDACTFTWLKDWIMLENSYLLNLEGHEIAFGWHAYMWYDKIKANKQFSNHYIRGPFYTVWMKYKKILLTKILRWISPHEALFSLFSLFYKIFAKIIANRTKKIIIKTIGQDQYGFVKGRNIAPPIRNILNIMNDKNKKPITLIKLDIFKAFDTVGHDYLYQIYSSLSVAVCMGQDIGRIQTQEFPDKRRNLPLPYCNTQCIWSSEFNTEQDCATYM